MKLPGQYKGKRRRVSEPVIIIIECPGCGWHSQPDTFTRAETEYSGHLQAVHYGELNCVFCKALFPTFGTLAAHVQAVHLGEVKKL